ncbi:hypothetical protein [Aquipseudomonas alcaligenes]|uniref:Uncharacterized protein n=1 Tax=Aquipseudomonas alcaligenes TaxID=43263 RepID=A0A1N6SUL7_AQUAC|nr:hypothetical protein [Pseudomonas alcaligenes]SIQ44830.1 hypothetical protein SAMN05878282_104153 [Pseudomonas alcaligenes]
MNPLHLIAATVLLLLPTQQVLAAGGTGEYALDWPVAGETLVYRSCGCADDCWVAELRDSASAQVKASLSCDCSELFYAQGTSARQPLGEACAVINDSADKAAAIGARLHELLSR